MFGPYGSGLTRARAGGGYPPSGFSQILSPILRKFDFFTPCDLKFDLIKNDLSFFFVELATAYPTPFTACRYLS